MQARSALRDARRLAGKLRMTFGWRRLFLGRCLPPSGQSQSAPIQRPLGEFGACTVTPVRREQLKPRMSYDMREDLSHNQNPVDEG